MGFWRRLSPLKEPRGNSWWAHNLLFTVGARACCKKKFYENGFQKKKCSAPPLWVCTLTCLPHAGFFALCLAVSDAFVLVQLLCIFPLFFFSSPYRAFSIMTPTPTFDFFLCMYVYINPYVYKSADDSEVYFPPV